MVLLVAGNAVLLALALALLAGGIAEVATINVYAEMPLTIVVCAGLAVLALLGVAGSARLKAELMEDADGRETTAQRCVEVYFWAMATLCVGVAIVAVSYLVFPNLVDIGAAGATEPERLQRLAALLGVGAAAGDGTVESVAAFLGTLNAAFAAGALVVIALIVPLLVAAARIVTYYEIRQGLLVYHVLLHGRRPRVHLLRRRLLRVQGGAGAPRPRRDGARHRRGPQFALRVDDRRRRRDDATSASSASRPAPSRTSASSAASSSSPPSRSSSVAVAVFALVASLELFDFVDPHCKSLINFGHEDWLVEMVPGVGCTKYYGVAISIVDDVIIESTDGVGQIVQCNAKEESCVRVGAHSTTVGLASTPTCAACDVRPPALGACCSASSSTRKLAQLFAIVSSRRRRPRHRRVHRGTCAPISRAEGLRRRRSPHVVREKHQQGRARAAAAVVTKRMYGDDGGYGAVGAAPLVK